MSCTALGRPSPGVSDAKRAWNAMAFGNCGACFAAAGTAAVFATEALTGAGLAGRPAFSTSARGAGAVFATFAAACLGVASFAAGLAGLADLAAGLAAGAAGFATAA